MPPEIPTKGYVSFLFSAWGYARGKRLGTADLHLYWSNLNPVVIFCNQNILLKILNSRIYVKWYFMYVKFTSSVFFSKAGNFCRNLSMFWYAGLFCIALRCVTSMESNWSSCWTSPTDDDESNVSQESSTTSSFGSFFAFAAKWRWYSDMNFVVDDSFVWKLCWKLLKSFRIECFWLGVSVTKDRVSSCFSRCRPA